MACRGHGERVNTHQPLDVRSERGHWLKLLGLTLIVALVMVFAVSLIHRIVGTENDFILCEASSLLRLTTPEGSPAPRVSPVTRADRSASLSWEIDVRQPWPECAARASTRLTGERRTTSITETSATFAKDFPGDMLEARFEPVAGVPGRIRVVLTGSAN